MHPSSTIVLPIAGACLLLQIQSLFAIETIRVGDSAPLVRARLGTPTRSVETGDGEILFYGPRMFYIAGGTVEFMSTGDPVSVAKRVVPSPVPDPSPSFAEQVEQRSEFVREHPEFAEAVERSEWALIARLRRAIMKRAYASVIHRDYFILPIGMISWSRLGVRDARGTRLMDSHGFVERQPISYYQDIRIEESTPRPAAARSH